eukprot:SAG11_NODE_34575_length_271_cov_0.604651_1_plen_38_part_10
MLLTGIVLVVLCLLPFGPASGAGVSIDDSCLVISLAML